MKSGKVKSFHSEESNQLNLILTEPEDEEKDSVTCTVEESDLNCPEEEMLDLTITDEFTEECGRWEHFSVNTFWYFLFLKGGCFE